MKYSSPLTTGSDIIAALLWGPKTLFELVDEVQVQRQTLRRWLLALRAAGVIYQIGTVRSTHGQGFGPRRVVWALQPKPFHHPDTKAPYVPALSA